MDNDEKTPAPSGDGTQAENAAAETPTERLDEASAPAPAAPAAAAGDAGRPSRRTRGILIGAGAAVALLAVGGGAFAIGSAVADDDDDDRPGVHAPAAPAGEARGAQPGQPGQGDDRGRDRDDGDRRGDDSAAASASADADALRTAAEAAIAHVSADGVTSIELERGGYDIDARLADGTEADLFVTPEGAVRERGDDDDANDDDGDDPLIDLARLDDILAAAQSAATDAGATEAAFHSLSTSSSEAVYEVELRTGPRGDAEVELDADLSIVRVDIDD